MLDLNEKLYEEYLAGELPVLVEFWAPWCVYCRRITVAMEQIAKKYENRIVVARVNIDECPDLTRREHIEVVPTLVLYRGGKSVSATVAPGSAGELRRFLDEALAR